jgi:hypothetical protein
MNAQRAIAATKVWRADFSPRGASAPLVGSEAKASRGLKPAFPGLFAAKPRCATILPNPTPRNVGNPESGVVLSRRRSR